MKQSRTARELRRLALPLIVANLSVPLLGMVDTAVVGHLDNPEPLGAVAIGGVLFSFLYWGFGFLRMGTTGLTAQAVGEGSSAARVLQQGLLLALAIGLALILLHRPIGVVGLGLLAPGEGVRPLAETYFAIRILSAPAALIHYVVAGWFLGRQNARVAVLLLLVTNGLNIVLDLLFVVGLGWGVAGVAGASVIAEYSAALLGLLLVVRAHGLVRPEGGWGAVLELESLRRMVAVNGDLFVRTLLLLSAFAFFTRQGARQGEVILAANAVLMNFQTFMAYALDGFAHATESLAGRAVGQGRRAELRRVVRAAGRWSLGLALAFTAGYLLLGTGIIGLLTGIEEVRSVAAEHLIWAALAPLMAVWGFLMDGVFIGATWTRTLRNAMLLSLAVFLLAWAALMPLFGNHGLWLAFLVFLAARSLTLGVAYQWRLRRPLRG